MNEKNLQEILETVKDLLARHKYHELRAMLSELHEADIADCIEELEAAECLVLFRILPKDLAVDVFSYLESDAQLSLINLFSEQEIRHVLDNLATDDAVDMLEELPATMVTKLLRLANQETRKVLNEFLKYPEDSAGSIMTSEFTRLKADMTVAEAIRSIRSKSSDRGTFYNCYITSEERVLLGVITVKDLLLSKDEQRIGDIMDSNYVSAETETDQEEVVHIFNNYDLVAMPVVDKENRLVGVVTVDDVMDAAHEEATEDFEIMSAVSPSERPYLQTSVWQHSRNRVFWLLLLMISGMINGEILGRYEHAFVALPILVTFMPMLTDTGGNAGAQSSTLVIRGMALDEISFADFGRVVWKELRISLLCGLVLAALNFLRIYFMMGRNVLVSATVSITLVAIVMMAKLIGGMLPMFAKKLHIDPAIMAAPLITTLVDAGALIIYFNVASALLGL